jgi:hypothetical protein
MTQENKYRVNRGLKAFGLFVWALLTIATSAVVWNSGLGSAASILSGASLLANAIVIFLIARPLKTPEIEDPHFENPVEAAKKK